MATNVPVQHKRSSVTGNKPSAAQLQIGEIAINFEDKAIYTKDASNNIVELARGVKISTTVPTGTDLFEGVLWYDSTNDFLQIYNGTTWDPIHFTGPTPQAANTTFTNLDSDATGSGTSGSPYVINSTVSSGETTLVGSVEITGLQPYQLVSIIDLNRATNGDRFWFNSNISDASGVLRFNIYMTDLPASADGTTFTPNIKIGNASIFIGGTQTVQSVFTQNLDLPINTLSSGPSTWTGPNTDLTAAGDITISTDNVTFSTILTNVSNGDQIYVKWSGNPGSGTGIDSPHGTTITGTITSSFNGAVLSHSLLVDKVPDSDSIGVFTDEVSGTSTASMSNTVTVSGINSFVYLTGSVDAEGSNDLYSKNGAAFVAPPAAADSTNFAVNYDTLRLRHTTSATNATASVQSFNIGSLSRTWRVTTQDSDIVYRPSILLPLAGAQNIPVAPLTAASSAFSAGSTSGTHTSSDWELRTDSENGPVDTQSLNDTTNKTSWSPTVTSGIQYWIRVRYRASGGAVSDWSDSVSFNQPSGGGGGVNEYTFTDPTDTLAGNLEFTSLIPHQNGNVYAFGAEPSSNIFIAFSDGGTPSNLAGTSTNEDWTLSVTDATQASAIGIGGGTISKAYTNLAAGVTMVLQGTTIYRTTGDPVTGSWTDITSSLTNWSGGTSASMYFESFSSTWIVFRNSNTSGWFSTDDGVTWTETADAFDTSGGATTAYGVAADDFGSGIPTHLAPGEGFVSTGINEKLIIVSAGRRFSALGGGLANPVHSTIYGWRDRVLIYKWDSAGNFSFGHPSAAYTESSTDDFHPTGIGNTIGYNDTSLDSISTNNRTAIISLGAVWDPVNSRHCLITYEYYNFPNFNYTNTSLNVYTSTNGEAWTLLGTPTSAPGNYPSTSPDPLVGRFTGALEGGAGGGLVYDSKNSRFIWVCGGGNSGIRIGTATDILGPWTWSFQSLGVDAYDIHLTDDELIFRGNKESLFADEYIVYSLPL